MDRFSTLLSDMVKMKVLCRKWRKDGRGFFSLRCTIYTPFPSQAVGRGRMHCDAGLVFCDERGKSLTSEWAEGVSRLVMK
jgi:hypothetical protein